MRRPQHELPILPSTLRSCIAPPAVSGIALERHQDDDKAGGGGAGRRTRGDSPRPETALAVREPPHDAIQTIAQLRALDPRGLRGAWLEDNAAGLVEKRVDPGKTCCLAAKAMLGAATATLPSAMALNDMSNEQAVAAMMVLAFGGAAAFACRRGDGITCIFDGAAATV